MHQRRVFPGLAAVVFAMISLLLSLQVADAASIGVYSTGASVTGGRDNNYQVASDTTGEDPSAPNAAFIVTNGASGWVAPVAGSAWIGPQANQAFGNGCCTGSDSYVTTFDLAGLDPSTAMLNMIMSADDSANIFLNGVEVYAGINKGVNYKSNQSITVNTPADFLSGLNTLTFVVQNGTGPTGLDVEINGTASQIPLAANVPEPGTTVLLFGALFGLALFASLNRRQSRLARDVR